jgi:hypothetical protein
MEDNQCWLEETVKEMGTPFRSAEDFINNPDRTVFEGVPEILKKHDNSNIKYQSTRLIGYFAAHATN